MKQTLLRYVGTMPMPMLLVMLVWASSQLFNTAHAREAAVTGPSRVDFDDRLVSGQRRGTGAVYIFERQKVDIKSMVKKPQSYRQRIIASVQ